MIKFRCENCGRRFAVPEADAGKKGKCPRCKGLLVVPKVQTTGPTKGQSRSTDGEAGVAEPAKELTLLAIPKKGDTQDDTSGKTDESPRGLEAEGPGGQTEEAGKRRFPWFIDIWLYPTSKAGLITFGVIILIPLAIGIVQRTLNELVGRFLPFLIVARGFAFFSFFAGVVIGLYLYWYLCECVRASAAGQVRAPETLAITPGLGDLLLQTLKIVGCLVVFWGPAGLYFFYTHRTDGIFRALVAYGVLFFPMGLLAVIMFDSICALNPLLLIGSILRTLLPYGALVTLFSSVGLMLYKVSSAAKQAGVPGLPVYLVLLYLMVVAVHLLGRFYWRYQHKLDWGV